REEQEQQAEHARQGDHGLLAVAQAQGFELLDLCVGHVRGSSPGTVRAGGRESGIVGRESPVTLLLRGRVAVGLGRLVLLGGLGLGLLGGVALALRGLDLLGGVVAGLRLGFRLGGLGLGLGGFGLLLGIGLGLGLLGGLTLGGGRGGAGVGLA